MSTLIERLDRAFKEAMKNRQTVALDTLRMLRTAIRHREVELKRSLTEEEVQAAVTGQAKRRREAVAEYTKAGRLDLARKEEEELGVLLSFLPQQLSEEEAAAEVSRIIREVGVQGPQDLGKAMKAVMAHLKGRADGKMIQEIVRQKLSA